MAIHIGDIGTVIRVTVKENGSALNISTATGLQLRFRAPDGAVTNKTATFTTDGSNGQLQYTIEDGLLDETNPAHVGVWEVRPYFTLGSFTGHSGKVTFTVERVS